MRERVRTGLLVLAVVCLGVFLTYGRTHHAEGGLTTERHTLGLPFSPWYESVTVTRPGGFELVRQLRLLSASWLLLAAGGGAVWLRARLRPPGVGDDDDAATIPPGAAV